MTKNPFETRLCIFKASDYMWGDWFGFSVNPRHKIDFHFFLMDHICLFASQCNIAIFHVCLLDSELICLGKSEMVNLLNAGQYVKFYVYFEIGPAMNSLVNLQYYQTIRYIY